jgi:uncharacterized membrane protein
MRLPLLVIHVAGGVIGLLSGAFAMSFRKGSRGHRLAGDVFVVSMLAMGACGSCLALMKHQMGNVFGGLLTFYMVTTAWLSGRARHGVGAFDWAALLLALGIGGSLVTSGIRVLNGLEAQQQGVPLGMYFFMGSIPLLAAAGDIRMLVGGGIRGSKRVTRHLWRMCFGWFIATGSFFLGQQQVFPSWLRGSSLPLFFAILPLLLLIFHLIRIWFSKQAMTRLVSGRTEKANA